MENYFSPGRRRRGAACLAAPSTPSPPKQTRAVCWLGKAAPPAGIKHNRKRIRDEMDEVASFKYFKWQDLYHSVKPYLALMDVPEGVPRANFEFEPGPEEIVHDMRGHEHEFTLDKNAFAVRFHESQVVDFNKDTVEQFYFPEIEDLLRKEIDGISNICFFDWKVSIIQNTPSLLS
jgi:hypothetical protein